MQCKARWALRCNAAANATKAQRTLVCRWVGSRKEVCRQVGSVYSLFSASSAPNRPASVSLSTSGLCVATALPQCCEKSVSSALVRRGCPLPVPSSDSMAQRARMMGSDGAGKSGGSGTVMGMEKCRAQRRRSRLIQASLSAAWEEGISLELVRRGGRRG